MYLSTSGHKYVRHMRSPASASRRSAAAPNGGAEHPELFGSCLRRWFASAVFTVIARYQRIIKLGEIN